MATFVRTQEIEHEIGPSGRFALRVTNPDAELRAVDGGLARVRIQFELRAATESEADEMFDRVRFHDERSSGSLEVTEPKRADSGLGSIVRILGIGNAKMDDVSISAELPVGAEVTYDGISADLTATGFRGTQQYRTVSGDLVLDELAGDVQVRGVSGGMSIRADDALTLRMNTVSGDISAFAPRFNELRLATVSGNVEIEGDLAADHRHRVETVSGDLSLGVAGGLTLEVRALSTDVHVSVPHRSEGSRDRRRYVIGDGAQNLLFSSMSGNVSVGAGRRSGAPPVPPVPPAPPVPAASPAPSAPSADEQLRILRALERGEIDIEEASARLSGRKTDA